MNMIDDVDRGPGADGGVSPGSRAVKSYVLRAGRMSPAQERARAELFPRFGVPVFASPVKPSHPVEPDSPAVLDYTRVFGNSNPVTVEIGFGMGAATAQIAAANPQKNYLGIEVFRPGVGRLLYEIEKRGLSNIRIIEYDAAEVFQRLIPDRSLAGVHLFFPDPWPKKRHHKRRLVTRPFTDLLARKLRLSDGAAPDGAGYLYLVTDWEDYAYQAREELSRTPGLGNPYARTPGADAPGRDGAGFAPPQSWRPETKFERKGKAQNHGVWELYFEADNGKK
jgi:tRNA (guanine-N7-)-methyltransferase